MERPRVMVGFSAAPGLLGALIRSAEGGGAVSHAFLAWDDPCFGGRMTLGANWNGLTLEPFEAMAGERRRLYLANFDLWPGIARLRRYINRPYDYAALFGMTWVEAEKLLAHRLARNPLCHKSDFFCSEYVTAVIRASGYDLLPGVAQGSVDPEQLLDAVLASPEFRATAG
ncbi:MAG TPA: hypothetical protein VKV28_04775 [Candidatus Binataceae bacterium]|nr:hypothetical protein [Candidatus Binataceae bacterium]